MSAKFPASKVKVYVMYYTFCEDPDCGALNDYADTRADGQRNRQLHIAAHRAQDERELRAARGQRA